MSEAGSRMLYATFNDSEVDLVTLRKPFITIVDLLVTKFGITDMDSFINSASYWSATINILCGAALSDCLPNFFGGEKV